MIIFPAIDLRGGKCVRLFKGDFSRETIFSDNPSAVAVKWEEAGAKYLHVVDLDGALRGKSINRAAIRSILSAVHIPVELGGGIRSLDDLGIQRVILGSAAVENPDLVKTAWEKFGERVIVAIDARDGIVATQGWESSGGISAVTFAKQMAACGIKTAIYTDIARDGTLQGINLEATIELAKKSGLKVIASGGVSSLDDIRQVKEHEADGLEGVIVGQAIYTGRIDLSRALAIAAGE